MSIATAYRYLHEAIDVIAAHAPDLREVFRRADLLPVGTGLAWTRTRVDSDAHAQRMGSCRARADLRAVRPQIHREPRRAAAVGPSPRSAGHPHLINDRRSIHRALRSASPVLQSRPGYPAAA